MTKQDRIKEAYAPWWEHIKDYLDEDGWYCMDEYYSSSDNFNTLSGLTQSIHPIEKRWRRAVSLDGLENNNGWIKFNSEVKIEPTANYWVLTETGAIAVLLGAIFQRKNFVKVTHIQPIEKPEPILYDR